MRGIYFFSSEGCDGDGSLRELLGGKGANLQEMARLGLPVPPGFTLTTEVCAAYRRAGRLPDGLMAEVREAIGHLGRLTGKRFGDPELPLLVSVRSGAAVSMPGMMDTVLNLGIGDAVCEGLGRLSGSPRFARDAYRRFVQMYGDVVEGVPAAAFEHALGQAKTAQGAADDADLSADALAQLIARYREIYAAHRGAAFSDDPWLQLERAIEAVFRSWGNARAVTYRRLSGIPDDLGTAVTVQAMVFGNLGPDCGTGVAFTRDPSTGERVLYGEYLPNAQGEDVVAGVRTPLPLSAARALSVGQAGTSLEERFGGAYRQLVALSGQLEAHQREVQDLEFTFEHGRLYLLQTRTAKRTGRAWVRTQVDLVAEGVTTPREAIARIPADSLAQILAPTVDPIAAVRARRDGAWLGSGLNAGPGAASGRIAFSAEQAQALAATGTPVLLVREETTPDDIHGMHVAAGILTARGGMTSHAAVVARGMGKPCIVGCRALEIHADAGFLRLGGRALQSEDRLTLDGSSGEIFAGQLGIAPSEVMQALLAPATTAPSPLADAFLRLMGWVDGARVLRVRANADTAEDSRVAVVLGAEGIGLCRTEHMFFAPARILAVRSMILAADPAAREAALAEIEPMQTEDFCAIFRVMAGRPVTIRTLDPPLHEFLPDDDVAIAELATHVGSTPAAVQARVRALHEVNPMLGHRGCRLGLHFPEVTRMQARAIVRAALTVAAEGVEVRPEIMVPLVGHARELQHEAQVVRGEAEKLMAQAGQRLEIAIGTMIEVPRAALTASEVAAEAAFFSFGTNDLTQMTLGMSRDDAGSFLPAYLQEGIYAADPFVSLDTVGVGRLMRLAVEEGRRAHPGLKVGICGEHGGDPASITFCHQLGLDYVSCSPYRVPVARLAAAQAALAGSAR